MTTPLDTGQVFRRLETEFPGSVVDYGETAVLVNPDGIEKICRLLKDAMSMDFLVAITAVDFIEYFEVVYHLNSITQNQSLVLKARIYDRQTPALPSVIGIWQGADLQEREVWDLMGVGFLGRPDMKRILTWEGFPGHPLQKTHLGG